VKSRSRRRRPHVTRAANTAKQVLAEVGVEHPAEIAIETLAFARRVLVRDSPSSGARATLVRVGGRGIVGVASSLPPPQRRFAVAHELGHFEVHPAHSYAGLCHGKDLLSSYQNDGREAEANAFAAELLMPEALLARRCDVDDVNWSVVKNIADEFEVSLTASAIRFAKLCPEAVAVVWCRDGKVVWTVRGPTFRGWIAPGRRLDSYCLAYDYFHASELVEDAEPVPASAWLDDGPRDADLIEHVIALPNYESVLSLLWAPDADEDAQ
jgi:hypothetical protein